MATRAPKRPWPVSFSPTTAPRRTCSFIRFPMAAIERICTGQDVSDLTLQQLQAINGTLSVTSQGYQYSATINLADVTSLTLAATDIQAALNENLPVAAVTTGDSIKPVSVSFTGSANGLLLDVTSIAPGRSIEIGALISGAGVPAGTQINSQFTGAPGGVGLYSLYVPAREISIRGHDRELWRIDRRLRGLGRGRGWRAGDRHVGTFFRTPQSNPI